MSEIELSVVVPVHNESANIEPLYWELVPVLETAAGDNYEIIYVNDGSTDDSGALITKLRAKNNRVKLLQLSRNFGKELALAAGIKHAGGQAILTIDGDGQHPVERIPDFVRAWRKGAQVVVGIRISYEREGLIKKYGSRLFYYLFNHLSGTSLLPGATDFRLIDQAVQREFNKLSEPGSITRGLIDWLGFRREYIEYHTRQRMAGSARYKTSHLIRLAANSFVSLSPLPLYLSGYLGMIITLGAFLLGLFVIIEQLVLNDPWHLHFTGTAMLSILVLFLVGIVLISQGIMALYISHIHNQTKGRPLFVVDYSASKGLPET